MTKKIQVKICAGTHCYVMGGSELISLEDYLTDEQKQYVDVVGSTCLNYCKKPEDSAPPYAIVNDQVISKANIPKLLNIINKNIDEIHK